MRRAQRVRVGVGVVTVLLGALATGVLAAGGGATPPSVTAEKSLVDEPDGLVCDGTQTVRVEVTGAAGVDGEATDVIVVLDLSGSMANKPNKPKFDQMKAAAEAFVNALKLETASPTLPWNRAGMVTYKDKSGTANDAVLVSPLPTSTSALVSVIRTGLGAPSGGSTHAAGIQKAQQQLTSAPKAMVLFTDGLTNQTAALNAANAAKAAGIRIATVGIGADAAASKLKTWASDPAYYQAGGASFSASELVKDVGAAVAVPVSYELTETLGPDFVVEPDGAPLTTTGTFTSPQPSTQPFEYTVKRSTASSTVEEDVLVSTSVLEVGGVETAFPTSELRTTLLPCGAAALLEKQECVGAGGCGASATQGDVTFNVDAGDPAADTKVFVSSLSETPPAGVCPGFVPIQGVQFDVIPLSTTGNYTITIPQDKLGTKKWWEIDICLGTNLKFTTKIGSLANLRPPAQCDPSECTSLSRWWGLLPSIPRLAYIDATVGWVFGPWITGRAQDASGNAVIKFKVPFVPGSESATTNDAPGYDPRPHTG